MWKITILCQKKCLYQTRKGSGHVFLCWGYQYCLFLWFFFWAVLTVWYFSIKLLNYSLQCGIFLLNFWTVPTVWYFSIKLLNCSYSVVFSVFHFITKQNYCVICIVISDTCLKWEQTSRNLLYTRRPTHQNIRWNVRKILLLWLLQKNVVRNKLDIYLFYSCIEDEMWFLNNSNNIRSEKNCILRWLVYISSYFW